MVCYTRPVSNYVENEKENILENCVISQQSPVCIPIVLQIKISYLGCQHLNINLPSIYILALTILMPSKVHECLRDFMHGYAKEKSVLMCFKDAPVYIPLLFYEHTHTHAPSEQEDHYMASPRAWENCIYKILYSTALNYWPKYNII